jgi:hypothetical protein
MPNLRYLMFLFLFVVGLVLFVKSAPEGNRQPISSIIMYPAAPDPSEDKCLIRLYLPEGDPTAAIRILNSDSTLAKDISLSGYVGITSAVVQVSDMKSGTYIYQLYYKGELRNSRTLTIKH